MLLLHSVALAIHSYLFCALYRAEIVFDSMLHPGASRAFELLPTTKECVADYILLT